MAAVGSDYIENNIDSRTGRNWKNLSDFLTFGKPVVTESSMILSSDCAGVLVVGT